MIVLFLAFSIPPDWVYLNAKTVQDRHTQRGIEMDNKVLDEAVEVAQRAWRELIVKDAPSSREAMRAALLAGLKVLLGPVVGYMDHEGYIWTHPDHAKDYFKETEFTVRPVYAPSLGEGDGR